MYYLALLKERINQKLRHLAFLIITLILSDKALGVVAFKETITGGFFLVLFSATGDLFSLFMALWSIATIALVVFAYLRRDQMLAFCRKWQEGQTASKAIAAS